MALVELTVSNYNEFSSNARYSHMKSNEKYASCNRTESERIAARLTHIKDEVVQNCNTVAARRISGMVWIPAMGGVNRSRQLFAALFIAGEEL